MTHEVTPRAATAAPRKPAGRAPIGISDFEKMRTSETALVYVDKTQFITDVLQSSSEVMLFPRPRRFGKTLNLSALRCFVEKSPESGRRAAWFEGLRVWASAEARPHFGRYPVIHLTLKDAAGESFASLFKQIRHVIADLYNDHSYLPKSDVLETGERAMFERIQRAEGEPEDYHPALLKLSRHLARYHQERVVILIDEYDTPIHAGDHHGYLPEVIAFIRSMLSGALKDNPYLFKGVLTGVLRVARESLFSGLNNIAVYSILRPEFAEHFGFTDGEVQDLCRRFGDPSLIEGLREWYNGYLFGDAVMFNPWSVMCSLDSRNKALAPYWANTSSNELIRRQLFELGRGLGGELSELLAGKAIRKPVDEDLALRNLDSTPDALWSLLLFSGYLKLAEPIKSADLRRLALTIPNNEVRHEFEKMTQDYFSGLVDGQSNVSTMLEALLRGDGQEFERHLNVALEHLSYHDKDRRHPERVYHVFLLGMMVNLAGDHEVMSNRESGGGRYDLCVIPRRAGEPGACIELKRSRGDVEGELDAALRQIEERRYTAELERRGASPIHRVAVVFDDARAWIRLASAHS